MEAPVQSLEIHLYKMDGSVERFMQDESNLVKRILQEFQPAQIFTREKIIIVGGNSLTSLPTRQVVRMDLISEPPFPWMLPPGIVDAVELTGTEFQSFRQNPELGDPWSQARKPESSVVTFLEVEMTGQPPLFLALEMALELPPDRPEAILYPLYPLAVPTLCFRMRTGGVAALNLLHLMRFTFFPMPQMVPVEAWPARQARPSSLKRPTRDFHRPMDGRQSLSPNPPERQMDPDPARRSPNENVSTMERKYQ